QQLDGLTSTREDQRRLEAARDHVRTFLDAYRRYVTGVLTASIGRTTDCAASVRAAEREAHRLAGQAEDLERQHTEKQARLAELSLPDNGLPLALHGHRELAPRRTDVIRTRRTDEPEEHVRPAADPLILTPDDLDALIATARAGQQAAKERSAQAGNRAVDAR